MTSRRAATTGRGAVITGAGRGLGRALALELGRRGWRLGLVARSPDELRATVEEARAAGGQAWAIPADVGDPLPGAARGVASAAQAVVGPVDLVVHAAGTLGASPLAPLHDTEPDELERALQVNLLGPFRLTPALLGPMLARGAGTVVFVSSDAALEAYPEWGAYSASKAGLEQLGRVWARELEGTGVRLLTVDPGEMDTRLHAEAVPDADRAALLDPARVARWLARLLLAPAGPASGERLVAPAERLRRPRVSA